MADVLERFRSAVADRYTIERELGQGGMAWVYLAQDLKHRRPVAIKVLRPELGEAIGADRFVREIETAAKLTHPHILPLHDSGEAAGLLYYVMPFIEGESLRDRLQREIQLPLDEALKITCEVADALAYAHSCGVVHRDVKPENILLKSGHAFVADFGIARAISVAGGDRLTYTGLSVGTPAYMSPEQVEGAAHIDGRSDLYSLASVLYESLAGETPFHGPNAQAIFVRRMTNPVPSVRAARPQVPEHVEHAIARALAPTPADRFTTTSQFADALSGAAATSPVAAGSRARLRLTGAVAAGVVLILAAAIFVAKRISTNDLPMSAAKVAVLPFTVRSGGSFAYLAEGMVDLLSRDLDGAGDLHAVDPGTILTAVSHAGSNDLLDVRRGRRVARQVGAGLYVLGSVNSVGPQVRLQAALYDASSGSDSAQALASVEGDSTRLFDLVDKLSRQLMVKRGSGLASRLGETAAITTRSLSALKSYLDGERRLRAASLEVPKLDSAIALFQQAVGEDSLFALAHYRMAVAAGWADHHALSSAAASRALTLSDRLNARDRRLLAAYVDFRRGAANDAERQYRAILQDYPDDIEARFQLADVLYNYNPLRGRPRGEAREPFNEVLAVDPGFL
ncbi:MAG TPA: serine/threonine-protein kinase [Gemmatimonadaceae bacterium]|jgi:serine/threonine-protein kinase|nr:serine/threonine-protein kinase [Gemmatimonadaceae bacterium]